jgi:DNA-binding phage protein
VETPLFFMPGASRLSTLLGVLKSLGIKLTVAA